jgi:hypothetical protein
MQIGTSKGCSLILPNRWRLQIFHLHEKSDSRIPFGLVLYSSGNRSNQALIWGLPPSEEFQTIPNSYQCGLNVFPVSSSVFRRERIRGHPSAQAA